ncbi:hypothetical protein DEU56DRAFT_818346 [Suillus clintonianus]|uniref:uncharacterized protein n=1 Tax=Suillus clintonianus TaxID=1904413 RepID=UPI001B87BD4A|nr:uncharacterized protein DEU56DRAFT_818346 [Suillus clintonianus]KAG2129008.1 hypothetical protein DEU56DRAFT_818346 [Suillus clintonianus]
MLIILKGARGLMPEKRQPFSLEVAQSVDALDKMAVLVGTDLRALFSYYGEDLDSPEGPKPDDFFGMICSFSSSLQKAALEIHDKAQKKAPDLAQGKMTSTTRTNSEEVRGPTSSSSAFPRFIATQTVKAQSDHSHNLTVGTHERSASIGRGDLDEAIRTLREGRRKSRATPKASKIFLDGRLDQAS